MNPKHKGHKGYKGYKRYKAVLFDLDGTLLDTIEDLTDSVNNAFRLFDSNIPPISVQKMIELMGFGIHKLLHGALPAEYHKEEAYNRILNLFREEYKRLWAVKTHPYDGITETLGRLAEKGFKLAVFSNKNDAFVKIMVSHFFSQFDFAAVMGDNPSIPLKPDPAGALEIASALGVSPEEFLYIGDSDVDMLTANNADMFAIGVTWGYRSRQVLIDSGASVIIDSPLELFEKVDI